jgi:hypothetical protein
LVVVSHLHFEDDGPPAKDGPAQADEDAPGRDGQPFDVEPVVLAGNPGVVYARVPEKPTEVFVTPKKLFEKS